MGGEFGDLDAVLTGDAREFVAIILGFCGLLEVDQPTIPGGNLHALVADVGCPFGNGLPGIERRRVAGELREKQGWALDRLHLTGLHPLCSILYRTLRCAMFIVDLSP